MAGDSGIYVRIDGLDECLKAFKDLEVELRRNANSDLRKASAQVAREVVIPGLGGAGAPQEPAVLAAAGPKSDRYVVVAVPARKPGLSGLRKTAAADAKAIGWAIEGGSGEPQFGGPAAGSLVAKHRDQLARAAIPRYLHALNAILTKYGLR